MEVEVTCGKQVHSEVMASLMKRKGLVTKTQTFGQNYIFRADVPLREMFGYAIELRGITSGEG